MNEERSSSFASSACSRGASGFHGLQVWSILALGFPDLRLNREDFRVLRCVSGCGIGHFCARVSDISLKILFCRVFEVIQSI